MTIPIPEQIDSLSHGCSQMNTAHEKVRQSLRELHNRVHAQLDSLPEMNPWGPEAATVRSLREAIDLQWHSIMSSISPVDESRYEDNAVGRVLLLAALLERQEETSEAAHNIREMVGREVAFYALGTYWEYEARHRVEGLGCIWPAAS